MSKLVTIVGVGALGSHVVQFLRNLDVQLRLIDFDRVEQKNTGSQFHGKPHIGRFKVESLKQSMSLLWGGLLGTKVQAYTSKLTEGNVLQVLAGSDLVIDCLDNGASRKVVQDHVRAMKVPCLHGALARNGEFGRAVWDESFVIDYEGAPGEATCEDGDHLPFIVIVSSYIAFAAQRFLIEGKRPSFAVSPAGTIRI